MAKVKYDVSDVEPGQQIDFDIPIPKGAYRMMIADVTEGESQSSGNPMLTVEYEVSTGEHKGRKVWDYIVLTDSQAWKMEQFISALGKRRKGTLDTEAIIGERVIAKIKHEADDRPETLEANEGKPLMRARIGSVSAVPDTDEEEPEEEEAEEPEAEEEEEDLTYEDLQEYDRDDLEGLIEEYELEVKFNSKTKDDVLRERVAEEIGLEPEDEGEEDEEDEEEVDYSEMPVKDLRTECKSRGLSSAGPKSKLVKRLEEDDADDDGEPF